MTAPRHVAKRCEECGRAHGDERFVACVECGALLPPSG